MVLIQCCFEAHWQQKRRLRKRCGYLELWSETKNDSKHYKSRGGDGSAIGDCRRHFHPENWKLETS